MTAHVDQFEERSDSEQLFNPPVRKPNDEPIAGYRLVEPLGKGGFAEVWKCEAPGGLFKAIKFVLGNLDRDNNDAILPEQELQALEHIKEIRHPFLLTMERVEIIGGELMIVMELADKSLHDMLQEYREIGFPGIPREELFDFLLEAAEALDLLNFEHGLQHLDVKPRNLFVLGNHLKVADFGLVKSLGDLRRQHQRQQQRLRRRRQSTVRGAPLGVTPLYAAPEVFQGNISPQSDQYSLAIVFQELLTGTMPFAGRNPRQLFLQHLQAEPNLAAIPAADRPTVARALAKDPDERFASCLEFVQHLLVGPDEAKALARSPQGSKILRRTSILQRSGLDDEANSVTQPTNPDAASVFAPAVTTRFSAGAESGLVTTQAMPVT